MKLIQNFEIKIFLIKKAENIQWDYKNIYKTKGKLYPIKGIK